MYMLTYGSFENFCDVMVSQLTLDSQICKLKYHTSTVILIVKLNLNFKKMNLFLIDVRGYKAVSL